MDVTFITFDWMVLCGTRNGSSIYGIAVKNLLSTFIFTSVELAETKACRITTLEFIK